MSVATVLYYTFLAHEYTIIVKSYLGWHSVLQILTCLSIASCDRSECRTLLMDRHFWNQKHIFQIAVKSDEPNCHRKIFFPLGICLNHSCLYCIDKASVKSHHCFKTLCHQPWQLPWFYKCEIISRVWLFDRFPLTFESRFAAVMFNSFLTSSWMAWITH